MKKLTKQHKRKISISVKKTWDDNPSRKIIPKSHIKKRRKGLIKTIITKEHRKKISNIMKTFWKNNPEKRKHMSEIKKGVPFSKKHIKNLKREWKLRKNKTNYIPAGLGRNVTKETRQKIRDGNLGKIVSKKTRRKQRMSHINYRNQILINGKTFNSVIGKNEIQILDEIELSNKIKIIRQYFIDGYFVDGYCKKLNIAFEIDEIRHKFNKKRDSERQKNIQNKLNCKFIRIKDY